MTADQQQTILQILNDIFKRMDIVADIEMRLQDETVIFNIKTPDSAMLIGQYGVNLNALQYLARIMAHKRLTESANFIIDVEDYKRGREDFLKELARQAVARVRQTRERLLLKPMHPYERRVIHSEIANYPDIASESMGEEPERRVLIKPKE